MRRRAVGFVTRFNFLEQLGRLCAPRSRDKIKASVKPTGAIFLAVIGRREITSMSSRALFWLFCAALFAFAAGDRALALERSTVTAIGSNHLVVTTGGRKGTRVYTPDESADYEALVEGQEKVTATHDATSQEKLERCMASWDSATHITKPNWRKICERQLSDGSL